MFARGIGTTGEAVPSLESRELREVPQPATRPRVPRPPGTSRAPRASRRRGWGGQLVPVLSRKLPGEREGRIPREAGSAGIWGARGDCTYQCEVHQGVVAEPGERPAVRRPPPAAQAQAQRAARPQQRGAQQQRGAHRPRLPARVHAAGSGLAANSRARKGEPAQKKRGGAGEGEAGPGGRGRGRSGFRSRLASCQPAESPGFLESGCANMFPDQAQRTDQRATPFDEA